MQDLCFLQATLNSISWQLQSDQQGKMKKKKTWHENITDNTFNVLLEQLLSFAVKNLAISSFFWKANWHFAA